MAFAIAGHIVLWVRGVAGAETGWQHALQGGVLAVGVYWRGIM